MNYKHWCGCETTKENGVIVFKKICKRHKSHKKDKLCWIALQHGEKLNNNNL